MRAGLDSLALRKVQFAGVDVDIACVVWPAGSWYGSHVARIDAVVEVGRIDVLFRSCFGLAGRSVGDILSPLLAIVQR